MTSLNVDKNNELVLDVNLSREYLEKIMKSSKRHHQLISKAVLHLHLTK